MNGNTWEDAFALAYDIHITFNTPGTADEYKTLSAKWKDPQIRNATEIIDNALKLAKEGYINQRHVLMEVADIFGWDKARIEQIIEETGTETFTEEEEPTVFQPGDIEATIGILDQAEQQATGEGANGQEVQEGTLA